MVLLPQLPLCPPLLASSLNAYQYGLGGEGLRQEIWTVTVSTIILSSGDPCGQICECYWFYVYYTVETLRSER